MENKIIIASKYLVIRKIGEGGMAKVYLAYDQINERNVALKILKKENIDDRKIKKFKKEAETLALMDDENIVKIYDVGEDNNIHYIASEYIDGMTLKEYIKTCSPMPIEEIIKFTNQILAGAAHAHAKNVVHKDLKSQNILLDEKKKVKITDFGIADILDSDVTRTQSLMGTPQYIAPEILNRDALTAQSDIYSIGILMYEMCTTTVPFVGEKAAYIMIKQMNQPLPSIIAQRPNIPQSLENVIIKASAKKLENRYLNVEEMQIDLLSVLNPEFIDAAPLVLVNDNLSPEQIEHTIDISGALGGIKMSQIQEKKEKVDKSKKTQRNIIIGVVISILILFGAYNMYFSFGSKILMPDLIGQTKEVAELELKSLKVPIENINFVFEKNEEVESGQIISTIPPANMELEKDEKITITISEGRETTKIKNYVGSIGSEVIAELEGLGFIVKVEEVESDVKEGLITSQKPEEGSDVAIGDEIILEVSIGPAKILVPNFNGLTKVEVEKWARENGISLTFTFMCDVTIEEGKVINQSKAFNTEVKKGDQIAISISDGLCSIIPPTGGVESGPQPQ